MNAKLKKKLKSKKINLLPDSVKKRRMSDKAKSSLGIFLFFILIAIALSTAYFNIQVIRMNGEIEYITDKIQENSSELKSQEIVTIINNNMDIKNSLLQEVTESNKSVILITEILENNLPEGIKYVNLTFSSIGEISVGGVSDSNVSIAKFIHGIEKENFFDKVFVGSISKNEYEIDKEKFVEHKFNIVCQFGGGDND